MDFMKVFDQTVREIKREVNLKVLKVPEIEQKALDATDDEPWGPHGTALAEIANATKKFSECQIVMNVLWTRLYETGKEWRCVYKSLAVIEYLVSHGSERAVDDIIEHTFQISSLTTFEYVEPSGKDLGINVRKKAENIVTLLNNRDKIQEVRNKASANRDKYIGLSSSGITYKSGAPSYSSGGFSGGGGYGGMGAIRDTDSFRERNKERDRYGEQSYDPDTYSKSQQGTTLKKEYTRHGSKDQDNKFSSKSSVSNNYQSAKSPSNEDDDEDFDDFDPRGTSSTKAATGNSNAATGSSNQVDLFGPSLIDVFDAPEPVPAEKPAVNSNSSDVDLFADASFVSASPQPETVATSETQKNVDLFASQPAMISAPSSNIDFFAAPEPVLQPETKPPTPQQTSAAIVDPFATVPLNNFDGSDMFGSFTSHPNTVSEEPKQNPANDANLNVLSAKPLENTKPPQKKDGFQVKSGIWSDSLSRGLIDLNISAPKKVNLADVGIVGLTDTDEREKGPPTSFYMGRAMGAGSGLGRTSNISTQASGGDDFFSTLGSQQYQFNNLKK